MRALVGFGWPVGTALRFRKRTRSLTRLEPSASPFAMTMSAREERTKPETIQIGGYQIYGVSVGGVETCVCIPSLSIAFDSGKCPPRAVSMRYMALTHGHCDHVHGLPLHLATRNLQKLPTPTYILSPDIVDDVRRFVDAVAALERSSFHFDVHPMDPTSPPFMIKKGWLLKSFKTIHTVPSQGYILYKVKKRLKQEYKGIEGPELAHMRKNGIALDETVEEPEIAFTGDTTLDAIASCPDCQRARLLITEMTFVDDSCSPEHARKFGHIHIDEIKQRRQLFSLNQFVLFTHFSARYSKEDIQAAMNGLPEELRRKSFALGVGTDEVDYKSHK